MKLKIENKKSIAVVFIIGLTALLLAGPCGIVVGDDDNGTPYVKPGGAYIGRDPGGATWSQTIIPCDPASNRMAMVAKFSNINPIFSMGPQGPFLFPTTEYRTDFVGNLVRKDRNTWDFTLVGYGVEKPEDPPTYPGYAWPLTYIMVFSGSQTFSDCGDYGTTNITSVNLWAVDLEAGIDPDANGDGFPDEGLEPTYSLLPPGAVFIVEGIRAPVVP